MSTATLVSLAGLGACTLTQAEGEGEVDVGAVEQGVAEAVSVWITRQDLSQALQQQSSVVFAADASAGQNTIFVDENTAYQTMDGIGASLTDSSAWLIKNKLSTSAQASVMAKLFDPTSGIGVSWLRQPMGASDFTVNGNYSYDDMPQAEGRREPVPFLGSP